VSQDVRTRSSANVIIRGGQVQGSTWSELVSKGGPSTREYEAQAYAISPGPKTKKYKTRNRVQYVISNKWFHK
jgi:hypothetical protein